MAHRPVVDARDLATAWNGNSVMSKTVPCSAYDVADIQEPAMERDAHRSDTNGHRSKAIDEPFLDLAMGEVEVMIADHDVEIAAG